MSGNPEPAAVSGEAQRLRLLLNEDSPDDATLVLRALAQAGFQVEHTRVEDGPTFRRALHTGTWDVIISDYHLPDFDALAALELVRRSRLDVPFIVVSGTVGEVAAVEAMKQGARDYVMKSHLRKLGETVRRELREAELRRRNQALEEQVRQAQKMELVGHLASSVAHDFNNLLTVIISFTQMVHDNLPDDDPQREDLAQVVECGGRAAVLTRQLLTFSRKSVAYPQPIDLNDVVESSEKMLKRLLGPRIDYVSLPSSVPAQIIADRGLIEQVLMNLIVNARDAMAEVGKLTVETSHVDGRVMLAITDTGAGMTDEVQARIFEPFFTTKGVGRGTGLGLATVQSIVKQSKGEISVYSVVGRGTTFKIYFPVAVADGAGAARAAEVRGLGGTETVLVVEDQEPVRNAVMRVLKAKGYQVLMAARPRDALELIAASREPVHLVLTDFVLPDMTGRDLVDLLRVARPGIGVLYMSGYAGGALNQQGVIAEGTPFLQKPFSPEALGEKVRFALDACTAKRN